MLFATSGCEQLGDERNIDDVETAVAFEDDEGLPFGMHSDMVLVVDADALAIGEPQCEWPERASCDSGFHCLRCHRFSVVGSFRKFNSRQRPCRERPSELGASWHPHQHPWKAARLWRSPGAGVAQTALSAV